MPSFDALVVDIEGTITDIAFVKDALFPFAHKHVADYLERHKDDDSLRATIEELVRVGNQEAETDTAHFQAVSEDASISDRLSAVVHNVRRWIETDKKVTAMKSLQGDIWKEGYASGELRAHIYDDVPSILRALYDRKTPVSIYSSGSVPAQKLLVQHSVHGDLTQYFSAYFDTRVGHKQEQKSYENIAAELGFSERPERLLFLTDIEGEARAAKSAGWQAILVERPGNAPLSEAARSDFRVIPTLDPILE